MATPNSVRALELGLILSNDLPLNITATWSGVSPASSSILVIPATFSSGIDLRTFTELALPRIADSPELPLWSTSMTSSLVLTLASLCAAISCLVLNIASLERVPFSLFRTRKEKRCLLYIRGTNPILYGRIVVGAVNSSSPADLLGPVGANASGSKSLYCHLELVFEPLEDTSTNTPSLTYTLSLVRRRRAWSVIVCTLSSSIRVSIYAFFTLELIPDSPSGSIESKSYTTPSAPPLDRVSDTILCSSLLKPLFIPLTQVWYPLLTLSPKRVALW